MASRVVWFVAGVVFTGPTAAQTVAPHPEANATLAASVTPAPKVVSPRPSTRAARVGWELLGGFGGGVVGASVGAISVPVGAAMNSSPSSTACRGPSGAGPCAPTSTADIQLAMEITAPLFAAFATPLGVWFAGNLAGGNGGYGWSLLGELGVMVPTAFAFAVYTRGSSGCCSDAEAGVGITLMVMAPIAGAILGYELSSDATAPRPATTAGLRVMPLVDLLPNGGRVGLAGTF